MIEEKINPETVPRIKSIIKELVDVVQSDRALSRKLSVKLLWTAIDYVLYWIRKYEEKTQICELNV